MAECNNQMAQFDLSDVRERIAEIEEETTGCYTVITGPDEGATVDTQGRDVDPEREELDALKALAEEVTWTDSATFIRHDHFTDYAKSFAEGIGGDGLNVVAAWVDWAGFADSLKTDYIEVDFDGVTYFVRG